MKIQREPHSVRHDKYTRNIYSEEKINNYLDEIKSASLFHRYDKLGTENYTVYKFELYFSHASLKQPEYQFNIRISSGDSATLWWDYLGGSEWDRASHVSIEEILERAPPRIQEELIFHFNLFR